MRPNLICCRLLLTLLEESPAGFTLSEFRQHCTLHAMEDVVLELPKAEEYGLVSLIGGRYVFFASAREEIEDLIATMSADISNIESADPSDTWEDDPDVMWFTGLVTYPNHDRTQQLYEMMQVRALHPKGAALQIHVDAAVKGLRDCHLVTLMPGKVETVDPHSNLPVRNPDEVSMYVEVGDTSEVVNVYGATKHAISWHSISWANVLNYDNMADLKEDDPAMYEELVDFQDFCKRYGYDHAVGVEALDAAFESEKARLEDIIEVQIPDYTSQAAVAEGITDSELDRIDEAGWLSEEDSVEAGLVAKSLT